MQPLELLEEIGAEGVTHVRKKEGKKTDDVLEGKLAQPIFRRGVDGDDGGRWSGRLWSSSHERLTLS